MSLDDLAGMLMNGPVPVSVVMRRMGLKEKQAYKVREVAQCVASARICKAIASIPVSGHNPPEWRR